MIKTFFLNLVSFCDIKKGIIFSEKKIISQYQTPIFKSLIPQKNTISRMLPELQFSQWRLLQTCLTFVLVTTSSISKIQTRLPTRLVKVRLAVQSVDHTSIFNTFWKYKSILLPIIFLIKYNLSISVVSNNVLILILTRRAFASERSCKIWVSVNIVVIVPGGKQRQTLLCRLRSKSYFVGFAQNPTL